jgi:hypothetical protein
MTKYVMIALVLMGCSKKDDKAADKAADKPVDKPAAVVPIDVAAVNALVPASLKDKLVFEKGDVVNEGIDNATFTLAIPKGWKQTNKSFGWLEGDGFSKMSVGRDCGGECKPKDWEKMFEDMHVKNMTSDTSTKVIKDEKGAGKHVLIIERPGSGTQLLYSWWTEGADHAYLCGAELHDSMWNDAIGAFEKACSMINVAESKR